MIFSLCWSWFPFFKIFVEDFKVSSKQFCTFKNRQEYVPIYLEIFLNKGLSIRFRVPSIYPIHVIRLFFLIRNSMQIRATSTNIAMSWGPAYIFVRSPTTSMANCEVFSHAFIIQEQPPKNKVGMLCMYELYCPANQADWICVRRVPTTTKFCPLEKTVRLYV